MITQPRFLIFQNRPLLVSVTYQDGEITDINGPYQCLGKEGASPSDLAQGLIKALQYALHSSVPIKFEALPETLQKSLIGDINSEK